MESFEESESDAGDRELAVSTTRGGLLHELRLIDDDTARALAEYGKRHGEWSELIFWGSFVVVICASATLGALFHFNVWFLLFLFLSVGTAVATLLGLRVFGAFKRRDYFGVAKMLDYALWWNTAFYPLTMYTLDLCSFVQFRMLTLQGRHAEFEALTRVVWASMTKSLVHSGIPKNPGIAHYLSCAYVSQRRYDEAIEIVLNALSTTRSKDVLAPFNVVVLAICYVHTGRFDEAQALLERYSHVLAKAPNTVSRRVSYIEAIVLKQRGDLDQAEQKIEDTLAKSSMKPYEAEEFTALCYRVLADIRYRQNRVEEAELHYRNAIDLFKVNSNPNYFDLSDILRDYAQMLSGIGRKEQAQNLESEADRCDAAYLERELSRLDHIREAIAGKKRPSYVLTSLVNVGHFSEKPLAIAIHSDHDED
ncbi:MAG: tetratricopeptide repeat protein [Candidatus Obscuribacterales bacterium]|nr:tetratricopeptide repeat protein [Candidatus Obscuribacterales bacterium]